MAALLLVDTDANDGIGVRAMNLAQAVLEYCASEHSDPCV